MYIQFPDLTEDYTTHFSDQTTLRPIKTQFAFCTMNSDTTYNKDGKVSLKEKNFKEVSTMKNWWPTHNNEKKALSLWWWRNPIEQVKPVATHASHWNMKGIGLDDQRTWQRHCAQTQATGCGFKIAQPPLQLELHYRYHTLMRMPVEPNKRQKDWLTKCHYRFLDVSQFSSYWINGFDPETYDWDKVEEPYWIANNIHRDARFLITDTKNVELFDEIKLISQW